MTLPPPVCFSAAALARSSALPVMACSVASSSPPAAPAMATPPAASAATTAPAMMDAFSLELMPSTVGTVPEATLRAPPIVRSMARALIAVGAALALGIGILVVAIVLTRDEEGIAVDNLLSENFTRAVQLSEDRGEPVDLRELAPFAWQRVLIVARGTPAEAISRRLGYEWTGRLGFETGELLILLDPAGRVVRFFDYRGEGRFEGLERPFAELAREVAVFDVSNLVITPAG